jgi:glycosyltransferase involved in cell wall biosynthesis
MMRLCYLSNIRIPTEKAHGVQVFKMCEAFAQAGYHVTLAVSDRYTPIADDPFVYYGAPHSFELTRISSIDTVKFGRVGFWVQSLTFAWNAFWYLRRTRPDRVFTRDPLVVLAAHRAGIPAITWEVHVASSNLFTQRAAKHATQLVAISSGLLAWYMQRGVPRDRLVLAHDGVDLQDFADLPSRALVRRELDLPESRTIVEYVGKLKTMGEGKGVEALIEATGALLAEHPHLFLLVVGLNPDELAEAVALATQAGLSSDDYRFVLHVPHTEVARYLRAADVLVMNYPNTPHYAHMMSPLKLFEYMASGTAILTSDLPSIREVLTDHTAYFIAADSPASLRDGISYLANHPERREVLAARAQAESVSHTWEARARRILG